MAKALGGKEPDVVIVPLEDRFDEGEQDGWKFLFMGAMSAIRNVPPHRDGLNDEVEATEVIAFLSLLYRKLDQDQK
jgi:hypothetical protein